MPGKFFLLLGSWYRAALLTTGSAAGTARVNWNTSKFYQKWNQSMARVSLGKHWGVIVNTTLLPQTRINTRCQNPCMHQDNPFIYLKCFAREAKTNCLQPINSFLDSLHCSLSCVLKVLSVFSLLFLSTSLSGTWSDYNNMKSNSRGWYFLFSNTLCNKPSKFSTALKKYRLTREEFWTN